MAIQAKRDYYEILSVSRTATVQEIEKAFERLRADFHAGGKPKTIEDVEQLRQLRKAYDVLGDIERRRCYDRLGCDQVGAPAPRGGYDSAQIAQISRAVDDETKKKRNYWIIREFLDFFFRWRF
ncbi:MAG TPA: DnaJ domain-containing protein [Candidatus Angelobacter sp.]|nr:DnaJ domain-containing protein [Candidatus Angelobacter sp.]